MRVLSKTQKAAIARCLVEGNGVRSTARICGVSNDSVMKVTRELGKVCAEYSDSAISNLKTKRVECDELWSFTYAKDKNVPQSMLRDDGVGSQWTWLALDADTKLIISYRIGQRNAENAWYFMHDLRERLNDRVQITTDGLRLYIDAVQSAFGSNVDYSMLIKVYGEPSKNEQTRYSPPKFKTAKRAVIQGDPNPKLVSTSFVERQNLSVRMGNRRYTRLTNAHSKKAEMHSLAFAITTFYHNFCRRHSAIKTTPALASGIADKQWTIEDMVSLIPELKYNTRPKKGFNYEVG